MAYFLKSVLIAIFVAASGFEHDETVQTVSSDVETILQELERCSAEQACMRNSQRRLYDSVIAACAGSPVHDVRHLPIGTQLVWDVCEPHPRLLLGQQTRTNDLSPLDEAGDPPVLFRARQAFLTLDGALVFATDAEEYFDTGHPESGWNGLQITYWIQGATILDMISLGHGKTERDDWDVDIGHLFNAWLDLYCPNAATEHNHMCEQRVDLVY